MEQPGNLINMPSTSRLANSCNMADTVSPLEAEVNNVLMEEVVEYLLNEQGAQLSAASMKSMSGMWWASSRWTS